MTGDTAKRVMYVIVCGAGPAHDIGKLVSAAQDRAWDVYVIATPAALDFIDIKEVEALSRHEVRSAYQTPPDHSTRASGLPHADVIIVAPATYNTINKWASGVSDTYALGILAEAIGLGIPIVVLPFVNSALAAHFAFRRSVADLRTAGVHILLGRDQWEPHPPGTGGDQIASFPWARAVARAESAVPSPR